MCCVARNQRTTGSSVIVSQCELSSKICPDANPDLSSDLQSEPVLAALDNEMATPGDYVSTVPAVRNCQ